ncbi:Hypothetical predicted protein [Octopus vulgaris]|uniref:Secreted protein n=1 Tax=Octopus vulgaris TaxID=6645 RepID=A0AA36FCK7_OCTVU|nr:Hypothetical predicted protein [Octopus vulgaris]
MACSSSSSSSSSSSYFLVAVVVVVVVDAVVASHSGSANAHQLRLFSDVSKETRLSRTLKNGILPSHKRELSPSIG